MAKFPELERRAAEAGATPPQVGNLKMLFTMHGKMEPERWADFFPHVVHVHGKFYGIVDGEDPSIDWPVVARVLREQNYTGFISSEYEAHAYSDRYNAFDQIRAQHDMLKRLLEAEPAVRAMTADYDVLIVGSGPVGTAVARELADREPGLRVVVLEAGQALGDTAGGHVKNIADAEERDRLLAELATGPGPLPGRHAGPARHRPGRRGGDAERGHVHERRRDGRALDGGLPAAGRRRGARLHRPGRPRRGADPRRGAAGRHHARLRPRAADRRGAAGARRALRPAAPPPGRRRCRSR